MDLFEVSAREKRSTFVKVVVGCLLAFIIAPPLAQAAVTTIKGTVKIKDSSGDAIDSAKVDPMGLFGAAGSSGALAVRNFAGGGGFLGAGACAGTTPTDPLPAVVTMTNSIVTGMIFTGTDGTFTVTSDAVGGGALPLLKFRVTADNPNEFVGLGNGLTLTDALNITCTGTNGSVVVLGQ